MKDLVLVLTLLPVLAVLLAHTLLALGVSREAARLRTAQIPLYALTTSAWVLVVFLTGIIGLLVFWLIHHSALRDPGLVRR
ncbi:MAG: hypothetical protein IPL39_15490 [Opitutaceae bacterium]|nr:hypothetical protein [Opitutaceae bacterium]